MQSETISFDSGFDSLKEVVVVGTNIVELTLNESTALEGLDIEGKAHAIKNWMDYKDKKPSATFGGTLNKIKVKLAFLEAFAAGYVTGRESNTSGSNEANT